MHETVWSILTDPNHLGAEIIVDIGIAIAELPFVILWRRHHDRKVHGTHPDTITVDRRELAELVAFAKGHL